MNESIIHVLSSSPQKNHDPSSRRTSVVRIVLAPLGFRFLVTLRPLPPLPRDRALQPSPARRSRTRLSSSPLSRWVNIHRNGVLAPLGFRCVATSRPFFPLFRLPVYCSRIRTTWVVSYETIQPVIAALGQYSSQWCVGSNRILLMPAMHTTLSPFFSFGRLVDVSSVAGHLGLANDWGGARCFCSGCSRGCWL